MSREMENLKEIRTSFNLTQDELAKKIMIEDRATIAQYEAKMTPSMKVLIKLTEVFNLSLDFITTGKNCIYPRNLKLLGLAKSFDDSAQSQSRSLVEASIDVFLKQKPNIEIKQDLIDLDLKNDFHSNMKSIRSFKKISQLELAKILNVGRTAITQYEMKNFPTLENLQKLSELFDISMHALVTGQKLNFQFTDGPFGKTMLLADRLLTLEDHKYLIKLMENIIEK
jgi:transcriptional regulator with XRE-family HTH domain